MAKNLSIIKAMAENSAQSQQIPYLGLRQKIHEWETLGADQVLIHGIKHGVAAPMHQIPRKMPPDTAKFPRKSSKLFPSTSKLAPLAI